MLRNVYKCFRGIQTLRYLIPTANKNFTNRWTYGIRFSVKLTKLIVRNTLFLPQFHIHVLSALMSFNFFGREGGLRIYDVTKIFHRGLEYLHNDQAVLALRALYKQKHTLYIYGLVIYILIIENN